MIVQHSINLLEFLAAAVTILIVMLDANAPTKILAFTDSSSTLGWLYKASFGSNQVDHDNIARWLAKELVHMHSALYSQHTKGSYNFVADSLSRDTHIVADKLTFSFQNLFPEQMPTSFNISPPAARSTLLDSLVVSHIDQREGVAAATYQKQVGRFDRWLRFLASLEIEDDFLDGFHREQRTQLLSAFASACIRNCDRKFVRMLFLRAP